MKTKPKPKVKVVKKVIVKQVVGKARYMVLFFPGRTVEAGVSLFAPQPILLKTDLKNLKEAKEYVDRMRTWHTVCPYLPPTAHQYQVYKCDRIHY